MLKETLRCLSGLVEEVPEAEGHHIFVVLPLKETCAYCKEVVLCLEICKKAEREINYRRLK